MRVAIAIAAIVVLAGCRKDDLQKPDLPGDDQIVKPEVQIVERLVYVKVPVYLVKPEPVAEGPIGQCFSVAADRRAAINRCNAKLQQIGAIQGTEVQP